MSNIKQTKDGLIEKSTGRNIESPLDFLSQTAEVSLKLKEIFKDSGFKVSEIKIFDASQNILLSIY